MKVIIVLSMAAVFCCGAIAQKKDPTSKVDSCDTCDVILAPLKIACERKRAQVDRPSVKLAKGMTIGWRSDDDKADWTAEFRRSPCGNKSVFNMQTQNSSCEIAGAPGRYAYTVRLDGCARVGTGSITVVRAKHN